MASRLLEYELAGKLYESRRSAIWRACRLAGGEKVILKLLKPEAASEEELGRFRREYLFTSRASGPGVVRVHGLEEVERSLLMVLEDIGGESLDRLRARPPLPLPRFLALAAGLAGSVARIHERRLIHEDLNPANIVFNPESGEHRLIDFGIADELPSPESKPLSFRSPEGNLAFISPEQTGWTGRAVDCRSDLYSLGITFYWLLTGRLPFETQDVLALVHAQLAATPLTPRQRDPQIPEAVSGLVMKLMAKMPEGRYQTGWGLEADLQRCLRGLQSEGRIENFQLDRAGLPGRRLPPPELGPAAAEEPEQPGGRPGLVKVMKAVRAVSGEMEMERLLGTAIRLVVENAGATSGFLLLERDGKWVIAARHEAAGAEAAVPRPVAIDQSELVSVKVVRQVAATGQPLVLEDANSGQSLDAPHLRERTRSLLCAPLVARGRLAGVIYLVNDRAPGVFSAERRQLLEVLLSQLATSLDNARIYEELLESERKYRRMVDTANEGVWALAPDTRTTFVNARMAEMLGYAPEEMLGRPLADFVFEEELSDHRQRMENRRRGIAEVYERQFRRKDGKAVLTLISASPIIDEANGYQGAFAMITDISERKRAEESLQRLNRELQAISSCSQVLMRAADEQDLLSEICRIVCDEAGYRFAWVGYAENDEARSVRPVAWAGFEDGYLATADVSWADTEAGRGPMGTAIRGAAPVSVGDFFAPSVARWREAAQKRGYRSLVAFPLKDERGVPFGAFGIYSAEPQAFAAAEMRLLEQLAADLAFGIRVLRSRIERKRAERAAALMSHSLDNVRESAFLIDERARFHYVNEQSCRALGYSRDELLGMGVADVDPDFPLEHWPEHWEKLQTEGSLRFEGNHRAKDGRMIPVEINASYFVYDGQGYNLALARDISERKQAEESLMRLNRELRAISDCNQVLMRAVDEKALLQDICRIVCEGAGYRMAWVGYAEDDPDKTIRPVAWAGLDSGYIEQARLSWSEDSERGLGPVGKVIRSGELLYVQDFASDPQRGLWRQAALGRGYRSGIALPLKNESGKPFGVLLIYSSMAYAITPAEIRLLEELAGDLAFGIGALRAREERKQAERERERLLQDVERERGRLMVVLDTAPVGIVFFLAPEGQLALYNRAAETIVGRRFDSTEPRVSERVRVLELRLPSGEPIPAEQLPIFRSLKGESLEGVEMLLSHPSGREVSILANSAPIRDLEGRVAGAVLAFQDITPIRAQQRLREEFISAAAHELKTPVTTIQGYAELLLRWNPDQRQERALRVVEAQTHRISRRVQEMLGAVRFHRAPELARSRFDLGELAAQALHHRELVSPSQRLVIRREGPVPVEADRERLDEVLVSLLENASEASPGGGEIELRVWSQGGEALASVRDHGLGIPKERQPHVFEPFYEPLPSGVAGYRGVVGLTRYLSKLTIERHGGRIWLESEEGKGTTFFFALPLAGEGGEEATASL